MIESWAAIMMTVASACKLFTCFVLRADLPLLHKLHSATLVETALAGSGFHF